MTAASTNDVREQAAWLEQLLAGERLAVARALTAVEGDGLGAARVLSAIAEHLGRAQVVGVTGVPGAGKSTLVNAYVRELRRRGSAVAVVAIDPSSPLSGGAILGDRIRMTEHSGDPGVFVRSLASRGHLGGLSRVASRAVDVMDAAGFPVVVVETVGAGQSEMEVAEIADTKVVVTAPGLGDEIQALKAGILEVADVLVVNKADQPDAQRAVGQLEAMLALAGRGDWQPPVLATIALRGEGVAALADAIERHAVAIRHGRGRLDPRRRVQRMLAGIAAEQVREGIRAASDPALAALCDALLKGEIGFEPAALKARSLLQQHAEGCRVNSRRHDEDSFLPADPASN
jgi:LAO/AO transport system ATPase